MCKECIKARQKELEAAFKITDADLRNVAVMVSLANLLVELLTQAMKDEVYQDVQDRKPGTLGHMIAAAVEQQRQSSDPGLLSLMKIGKAWLDRIDEHTTPEQEKRLN